MPELPVRGVAVRPVTRAASLGVMVKFADPATREKLQRILDHYGFDPDAYSLFGGHPSEAYVLDDRGGEWVVYYSERGLESGLESFPNEDLACRHLAGRLWRDVTTRSAE